MDGVREFLDDVQKNHRVKGHLLGLLHILIGRRITRADKTLVSAGLTWRDLAAILKTVRWDPEAVRELGFDPDQLPLRDRQRYWYSAIAQAQVGSDAAARDGDKLAAILAKAGYVVSPSPGPK